MRPYHVPNQKRCPSLVAVKARVSADRTLAFADQSEQPDALYNTYSSSSSFKPAKMTAASPEALMQGLAKTDHQVAKALDPLMFMMAAFGGRAR